MVYNKKEICVSNTSVILINPECFLFFPFWESLFWNFENNNNNNNNNNNSNNNNNNNNNNNKKYSTQIFQNEFV